MFEEPKNVQAKCGRKKNKKVSAGHGNVMCGIDTHGE